MCAHALNNTVSNSLKPRNESFKSRLAIICLAGRWMIAIFRESLNQTNHASVFDTEGYIPNFTQFLSLAVFILVKPEEQEQRLLGIYLLLLFAITVTFCITVFI